LALARRIADMKLTTDGPVFALCRVMTASEVTEARAAIGNAGFETLEGELVERPGYRQAQNLGRSPTETAFPSLNGKARRLARGILDRLAWNAISLRG
jgi:chromosome partitioning protein